MISPWQGFGWTAQLFSSSSALDVLVIVLYFLLVLGIALWVSGGLAWGRGGANPTCLSPGPASPPACPAPAQPFAGSSPASLCSYSTKKKGKQVQAHLPYPPARINRSDGPARTAWDPRCVRYGGAVVVAGAAAEPYRAGFGIEGFERGASSKPGCASQMRKNRLAEAE